MAEKKTNEQKRRTQLKDLPQPEKALSKEEQKSVKGGETALDIEYDARGVAIGKGIRIRGG